MRRPHVYERSAPRSSRDAYREPTNPAVVGAMIADRLAPLIAISEATGLDALSDLLKLAQTEADTTAKT